MGKAPRASSRLDVWGSFGPLHFDVVHDEIGKPSKGKIFPLLGSQLDQHWETKDEGIDGGLSKTFPKRILG